MVEEHVRWGVVVPEPGSERRRKSLEISFENPSSSSNELAIFRESIKFPICRLVAVASALIRTPGLLRYSSFHSLLVRERVEISTISYN